MENFHLLKGHRHRRLPSNPSVSAAPTFPSHSAASYFSHATAFITKTDVTTGNNNITSSVFKNRLACCRRLWLTLVLTSSLYSLLHDFAPRRTSAVASTHEYPSAKATASDRFHTPGTIWAEATSRILPADRSGNIVAAAVSQVTETEPIQVSSTGAQRNGGGSPLPILLRRPYMTDNPEMVRFPLSVDADLTGESFEAIEKASLEIARAVRQQQQQQRRRREREEYLNGERKVPAAAMKSHFPPAGVEDKHERVDVTGDSEAPPPRVAAGSTPASEYKIPESIATNSLPPNGQWEDSMSDDDFDDDAESGVLTDEHIEQPGRQSGSDGTGGRLIVGLTEITFPEMKKKSHRMTNLGRGKMVESLQPSLLNAAPLREHAKRINENSLEDIARSASRWSGDLSEDGEDNAEEKGEEEDEFLSHKEAVREANQRLRLDQLQDLGIIKSVKVLENVGLVVLEFQDHLSEEDIKETIKTLWQRNKSTWLIEPDSEIVFRGRDSFERGGFVPVMHTAEEEVGQRQKEETTLESVPHTRGFLPGQEPHLELHQQQQRVQQEEVPQRSIRTRRSLEPTEEFAVPLKEKDAVEATLAPVLHRSGDAAQTHVSRTKKQKLTHGQTAPYTVGKRHANMFDVNRANATEETAETEKRHLPEFGERKKRHITKTYVPLPRTAAGRRLTVNSLAPAVQSGIKPYSAEASLSDKSTQQANTETGDRLDEPRQQKQQEAVTADATRNISYTTTVPRESAGDIPRAAFSGPPAANEFFPDPPLHNGEGDAEDTASSTSYNRSSTSLLKPHMGIVPLSLYDAAQQAVREALEENAAFRNLETSPKSLVCDECLKALAACERRFEFVEDNAAKYTPYNRSKYSSSSRSISGYSTTSTGNNSRFKQTCTEEGAPSRVTQALHEQTSSRTWWPNRTKETGGAETAAEEQAASPSGSTAAVGPIIATSEDPLSADEKPDVVEVSSAEEKRAAVTPEYDPNEDQMENSAHRRLIFASPVAPVSDKHLPNDQYFSRQWAYHGPRVNVQAVEAWNLVYKHRLTSQRRRHGVTGRAKRAKNKVQSSPAAARKVEPIVVAVIDTGIDYTHEDLRTQMWVNKGEIPDNGIDDDGNGYVDDYHGYDFEKDTSDPMDYNGHGTHVAGIIAAAANNRRGITGVNWEARLMPLKFVARSAAAAEAIDYSLRMGAKISTNSWGYASPSEGLKMAVKRTAAKGQLFVSAVDNAGKDNTYTPDYPPNWGYDKRTNKGARNILRVANLTAEGGVAGTSNFGPNNVDVVAPGTDIISTVPAKKFPEGYGYKTGTSMATPLVAGIAAMVWAAKPAMTAAEVRDCIIRTSTRLRHLEGFVIAGNVNAYAAVLDVLGPPKENSPDTKEEKHIGMVPPATQPGVVPPVPAASAAAAADNRLFYAKPVTTALVNGNIFPSEEAFFEHISQTQPHYVPPAVVAEHIDDFSKSPGSAEGKNESNIMNGPVAPSSVTALVSSLASLLGPLNKLLLVN